MTYIWPFASSKGGYIIVAILYGFVPSRSGLCRSLSLTATFRIFSGCYVTLFTIPILEMGPLYDYGTRVGFYVSIVSLGALAGPPISGAINERTDGFVLVGVYAGKSTGINAYA